MTKHRKLKLSQFTKRASRPLLKRWKDDRVPVVDWFRGNPVGTLIGLIIFFMVILYWTSGLPTDPFNADPNFISQWKLFYQSTKWFLAIAFPAMLLSIVYDLIRGDTPTIGASGMVRNLTSRLRQVQLKQLGPRNRVSNRQLNFFLGQGVTGQKQLPKLSQPKLVNLTPGAGKVIDAEFKEVG